MKLYIKNMVCDRCKTTVESELNKIGIQYDTVDIGEVSTKEKISSEQLLQLSAAMLKCGFELIDNRRNELIEKLKNSIIDLKHYSDEDLKIGFTEYVSLMVDDNFISLNKLFAEIKGMTIEKFVIRQKIEKIKEMLVYEDTHIDQIALKMHYSNSAALSSQFKRETGLSPSHFRQLRHSPTNVSAIN